MLMRASRQGGSRQKAIFGWRKGFVMNLLKIASLSVAAMVSTAFGASAASATTYYFSFSGEGYSGAGTFDATGPASPYTIDNVTGTAADPSYNSGISSAITGVSTFAGSDNALSFPDMPYENFYGISFATADGNAYNIYSNGGDYISSLNNQYFEYPISFNVSTSPIVPVGAVPELATWCMMLVGMGLIGSALRQRPNVSFSYA